MADDDDGLASSRDGLGHGVGGRARGETLVGDDLRAELVRDQLRRLSRSQKRAREDGGRVDACVPQPLGKRACLLAALGCEGAQLVGLSGGGLGMAHEDELHVVENTEGMGSELRRRPPRRAGKARSDAERRRLAQAARARPLRERSGRPVLWCDGGARGNPGPSAFGYVLEAADGSVLREAGGALGVGTASIAEYRGLIAGLESAAELGLKRLEVRMDSQLVVAQLTGERDVKNPAIAALAERARELAATVGPVRWRWVRREHNARANALVARVLGLR